MILTKLQQFQKTNLNHLGQQLVADDIRGKQTLWAIALAEHHPARRAIVLRALEFIGTKEEPLGSNRGYHIDMWLARCGVPIPKAGVAAPDNAWCAAFASFCLSVDGLPETKFARVKDLVDHFPSVGFDNVLPGDLGYRMNPGGKTGHVWIVSGREGLETMNVEGNTGNVVAVTRRPPASYLRTVSPPMMPGIPPGVPLAGTQTR